ncbi:hypothetical protein B4U79_18279 [Dinothrombium tinctorium]|uniref:F-box domain-containing protein n=1 Tax=Dinothrombium tinctorium TaxID=1965070 RepID=A0A443QSU9_9ACAR|nr:hypothetical protein B4U79_18280 [Dinothrombium tinctorium]RWS06100.1 hypothetical protein B4U79_18279 [Dinothrombium tinctorium]
MNACLFPDCVWIQIVSFLSFADLSSLSRTSRRLNTICKRELSTRNVLVVSGLPANDFHAIDERIRFSRNAIVHSKGAHVLLNQILPMLPKLTTLCIDYVKGFNEHNLHLIADHLPNLKHLWLLYQSIGGDANRALEKLFAKLNDLQTFGFCDNNFHDYLCFKHIPLSVKHLLFNFFFARSLTEWNAEDRDFIFDRLNTSVLNINVSVSLEASNFEQLLKPIKCNLCFQFAFELKYDLLYLLISKLLSLRMLRIGFVRRNQFKTVVTILDNILPNFGPSLKVELFLDKNIDKTINIGTDSKIDLFYYDESCGEWFNEERKYGNDFMLLSDLSD